MSQKRPQGLEPDPAAGERPSVPLDEQLLEAQQTLEAIRSGAVDAFVVRGPRGEQVYTLETADAPYRLMVEQMQQGAATVTGDGLVLYANPRLAELAGAESRSLAATAFERLFPEQEREAVRRLVTGALARPGALETRLQGAHGEVPVYLSASALVTEKPAVCVMVTDLTEQKRLEALESALEHFRVLADSSPVPIWVIDRDGGFQFVNRAYAEFFGVTLDEACSPRWLPPIHPEDESGYATGLATALLQRGELRLETRMRRRDGEWRWVAHYGAPWFAADGSYLGCVGSSPDVSDLKQVEQALRSGEERYRLATEALQGVIYDLDLTTGAVSRSRGLAEILGHAPDDAGAFDWWSQQLHPDDAAATLARIEAARAAHEPAFDVEYRMRHKDGGWVWIWDHGRLSYDRSGRATRLTGCMLSIDRQKQLEDALRRADRHKDRFLATLAHELRNPLAPIRNAIAILKAKGPALPELEWGRDVIDRQVAHMARMLDDLLDVSRITQQKLQLRRERLDLVTVVNSAVETARPAIEAASHALELSLPGEPVVIEGDLVRLSQALANLLNNAAKYTDPGGRIWLDCALAGPFVELRVRDTGIGIPRDALGSVFEMFSQASGALARAQGGLGIGLSLVRGIVGLHGGTVDARSDGPGKGSEFIMRLPITAAAATSVAEPRDLAAACAGPRLRVLVADDNRDTADSLAIVLSLAGYDVRTSYDGAQALAVAEEFRPHAALLDVGMPQASGCDVASRIRQKPWGRSVFLIAQTGWGQDEDQRRTSEAGFDHHLVKPVAPATITNLLASMRERALAE